PVKTSVPPGGGLFVQCTVSDTQPAPHKFVLHVFVPVVPQRFVALTHRMSVKGPNIKLVGTMNVLVKRMVWPTKSAGKLLAAVKFTAPTEIMFVTNKFVALTSPGLKMLPTKSSRPVEVPERAGHSGVTTSVGATL